MEPELQRDLDALRAEVAAHRMLLNVALAALPPMVIDLGLKELMCIQRSLPSTSVVVNRLPLSDGARRSRLSSGQWMCQSSGRLSQRITAPALTRSSSAQRSTGISLSRVAH